MKDMKGTKMAASNEWARQGLESSQLSTGRRNQKGQAATDCNGLPWIATDCNGFMNTNQKIELFVPDPTGYHWQARH